MLFDKIGSFFTPKNQTLIGGLLDVAGSAYATRAKSTAYEFNAAMAELEGESAQRAAYLDADTVIELTRRKIGEARAEAGSSGFATDEGTNLLVVEQLAKAGKLDAAMIRSQGDISRWSSGQAASIAEDNAGEARLGGAFDIGKSFVSTLFKVKDIGSPVPEKKKDLGPFGSKRTIRVQT